MGTQTGGMAVAADADARAEARGVVVAVACVSTLTKNLPRKGRAAGVAAQKGRVEFLYVEFSSCIDVFFL